MVMIVAQDGTVLMGQRSLTFSMGCEEIHVGESAVLVYFHNKGFASLLFKHAS